MKNKKEDKKTKKDNVVKKTIYFDKKLMGQIELIAKKENKSVSNIVRRHCEKGVSIYSYKEDTDYLENIIRNVVEETTEKSTTRLIKMMMKIGKIQGGGFFLLIKLLHDTFDEEELKTFEEILNQSMKLGIDYMKIKDRDLNNRLENIGYILNETERL